LKNRFLPLFLALLACLSLLSACMLARNVVAIDLEPGKAAQRDLIATHFAGLDTRRPPTPWPPASGERPPAVSAAWWGFNSGDGTAALQKALDYGAAVVLVPRMEAPWQCEEIFVRSNTTLILEDGAVLLAKKGAFTNTTQTLLNIIDVDNVTVSGYGAVIRMRRTDYSGPPYKKGEWRHTIQICGGTGITLSGLTAELSGGDGVYLGRGVTRITNTRIVLKDLVLRDHYRQGISVITARGLRIENVEMSRTMGTTPAAGIDFEPNLADEPVTGCILINCQIWENAGAGFQGYFACHTAVSEPFDITLEDCQVYGNLAGAFVFGFENGARGRITFRRTRVFGPVLVPRIAGQVEFTEE
jgi:hypothetical protein